MNNSEIKKPDIPEKLTVISLDGAVQTLWNAVAGADGYILSYYKSDNPTVCIKTRYAQKCSKIILGFKNGAEYYVTVRAFCYSDGKELIGEESEKVLFIPVSMKLKAQNTICLNVGESENIVWEYRNTVPEVTFSSSDESVAAVDEDGIVTAVSNGIADITLTMNNNEKATVKVRVSRSFYRKNENKAVIMLGGDLMCSLQHQRNAQSRSFDFTDSFELIRPLLESADFSVGVLETVCCDTVPFECEKKRTDSGSPNCNSPSSFIAAARHGGFSALVTANNHNCDAGGIGLVRTAYMIKSNGMYNIGTTGDNPVIADINGIKVAFIGCNVISNGLEDGCLSLGGDSEFLIGKYSPQSFEAMVKKAKASSAEYIIAYQHFGKMNSVQIRASQRRTAKQMADLGADFIACSHPHVLQSFDVINAADGRRVPCAYSLGNLLTSMNEMTENTESALLKLTLSRENGRIDCSYSFIPVKSVDLSDRVIAKPLLHNLTDSERITADRIALQLGDKIKSGAKPKFLLQGSVVLKKIFEGCDSFTADSSALILSPLSLMSKLDGTDAAETDIARVRLDIEKSFADYIASSDAEYIAVDFYTAAGVSCYKLGDSLYTASQAFCKSDFYKRNKSRMELLKPPFNEQLWKNALKEYASLLKQHFSQDKIILIRLSFSDKCAKRTQLRNGPARAVLNKRIKQLEEYFIELVKPVVIDVAKYYFADGEDSSPSAYEPHFYEQVKSVLGDIVYNKSGRYYYDKPDLSIWADRVVKYYDNMTARAYHSWLLDDNSSADIIMKYSSAEFISENKQRLIYLKESKNTSLCDIEKIFSDDLTAVEFISAAKAIGALLKGDLSQPYAFYSIIFRKKLRAVSLISKLLSEELKCNVTESNAETVFLLKDDREKVRKYFELVRSVDVDIWGSCISRESVKRNSEKIAVGKYIFKQPPVLMTEPDIDYPIPPANMFCNNSWRRRTVKEAFYHEGTDILSDSTAEWLIVDFYDLICRMQSFRGGLFETDDFIGRTGFFKSIAKGCTPTYLFRERTEQQCRSGMENFAEFVKHRYGRNVILITVDLKDKFISLDGKLEPLSDNDNTLEEKRSFLAQYESMFIELTDCYVVNISGKFYADDSFPLGGAHIVHYESEFYEQCGRHITAILNGTEKRNFSDVDGRYILERELKLKAAEQDF